MDDFEHTFPIEGSFMERWLYTSLDSQPNFFQMAYVPWSSGMYAYFSRKEEIGSFQKVIFVVKLIYKNIMVLKN